MTTGKALPDAACSCALPDSGSRNASTAATSTGRYSGRPPAIASAIAHVSTVVTPPRGGKVPSASPARLGGAAEDPVDALARRRPERQAVAPAVREHQDDSPATNASSTLAPSR